MQMMDLELIKRKISFITHVRGLPKNRWIHEAYLEQIKWAKSDGYINENNEIITEVPLCPRKSTYWIQQTISLAQSLNLLFELNLNKQDIKFLVGMQTIISYKSVPKYKSL